MVTCHITTFSEKLSISILFAFCLLTFFTGHLQAENTLLANTPQSCNADPESYLPKSNSQTESHDSQAGPTQPDIDKQNNSLEATKIVTDGSIDPIPAYEQQLLGRRKNVTNLDIDSSETTSSANRNSTPSTGRMFASLFVVLFLIIVAAYLFRRFALGPRPNTGSAAVEIIARNNITNSPKQSLCLVRLGKRLVLLGLSPNHMASLVSVDDPEEIAQIIGQLEKKSPKSITNTFEKMFNSQEQDYDYPADYDNQENDVYDYDQQQQQQWGYAKRELSSLLTKVKGLARLRFHS